MSRSAKTRPSVRYGGFVMAAAAYSVLMIPTLGAESAPAPAASASAAPQLQIRWLFGGSAKAGSDGTVTVEANPDPDFTPAPSVSASPTITLSDEGLTLKYSAQSNAAFQAVRQHDGIPFADKEARIGLRLAYTSDGKPHWVVAFANRDMHCYVDGDAVPGDAHDACIAATPSPTPSHASKNDPKQFDVALTIKYALLARLLRPTVAPSPEVVDVDVCAAITDRNEYLTDKGCRYIDPASADPVSARIESLDGSKDKGQQQMGFSLGSPGKNNAKSAAQGHSDPLSTEALVRALGETSHHRPSPSASAQPANRGGLSASLTYPFTFQLRGSVVAQNVDLSFLGQQTTNLLQQYTGVVKGALRGLVSSPNSSADFSKVDTSFFSVAAAPVRPSLSLAEGKFDANMQPIDFAKIGQINYGGKLAWTPLDGDLATAWFRNPATDSSGLAFHGDVKLRAGELSLTNVVANFPGKSDNVYITDSHTANTVAGLALPARNTQTFVRYGVSEGAHDFLIAESYARGPFDSKVTVDGTPLGLRALAGYRRIDAGYAPLATTYDPLVGTKSFFGLIGYTFGPTTSKHAPTVDLSLDGSRAFDSAETRYRDVTAKLSVTLGRHTVAETFERSAIADSVVARVPASVLVDANGPLGRTLQPNDSEEFSDTLKLGDEWSLKGGLRTYNDPSCSNAAHAASTAGTQLVVSKKIETASCASPLRRNLTESLGYHHGDWDLHVDIGSPKTVAAQAAIKGTVTNQLTALAALQGTLFRCFGVRASYGNNASLDTRAFVPGALTEASVDIDPLPHWPLAAFLKTPVIRVSYQNVVAAGPLAPATTQHNLFVSFVADDQAAKLARSCARS